MQIEFWNFSKKFNSTKTPSGSGATTEATLKQTTTHRGLLDKVTGITDTAMTSPRFLLYWEGIFVGNYLRAFGNYYFIQDIYYGINNIVELECLIDVLASYKTSILSIAAKVKYSSSLYDLSIDDTRNQLREVATSNRNVSSTFLPSNPDNIHYLLTTLSIKPPGISGKFGFAISYGMKQSSMDELITQLTNGVFTEQLSNFLLTPIDCVVGLQVTDFNIPASNHASIYLGAQVTNIDGYAQEANSFSTFDVTVNIPHIYGDYRDGERCSSYRLVIPYCGTLDIASSFLYNYQKVLIRTRVDCNTLDMICLVIAVNSYGTPSQEERYIDVVEGNCGRQIPIGQILGASASQGIGVGSILGAGVGHVAASSLLSLATGGSGGVLGAIGAASGGAVAASATGLAGIALVGGYVAGKKIQGLGTQFKGTYNSPIGKYNTLSNNRVELIQYSQDTCDVPTAIRDLRGLPLNRTVPLAELSGYCECEGASIEVAAPNKIRTMINQFLNGGFYIE